MIWRFFLISFFLLSVFIILDVQKTVADETINGNWHEQTATRERFCLNGVWDFHPIVGSEWSWPSVIGDVSGFSWVDLRVPGTWHGGQWFYESQFFSQAYINSFLNTSKQAWYKREFFVPADWSGKNVRLEFERVGYNSEVYVNGQLAGTHIGGATPFEIDITDQIIVNATNELLVFNERFDRYWVRPPEMPLTPVMGKYSGIADDVYLRANSKVFVNDVFVKTSVRNDKITSVVEITNTDTSPHTVDIENVVITDSNLTVLTLPVEQGIVIPAGTNVLISVEQTWIDPNYWSPDNPYLYYMKTSIEESSVLVDELTTRFGFREFWIDGKDFRLNGEIIRLRNFPLVAPAPHHFRPDWLKGWFTLMKKQGHNSMRLFSPWQNVVAEVADEVGLLVEEGSSFVDGDQRARWNNAAANIQTEKEFGEWIRAKRNHPSIVIWTTENECWSMNNTADYNAGDPTQVGIYNWLVGLTGWITQHDDTRVITNHSLGDMLDWTEKYDEDYFVAGDLIGTADNYNLHYPREYRYPAEQVELANIWADQKNKPLIMGEFSGPDTIMPGSTTDFHINGEDFLKGGVGEGKAIYYLFRRVVGGWRATGVSMIEAFWPNIYSVKDLLPTGLVVDWGDLTMPYMKPNTLSHESYNPPEWGLTSYPEYLPDSLAVDSNNRFWNLLEDTFAPLLINFGDDFWEHNYISGESVQKDAYIINDTYDAQSVTWSWILKDGQTVIASDSNSSITLAISEIKPIAFTVDMPTVSERTDLKLIIEVNSPDFNSFDQMDITVYPPVSISPPIFPDASIAVYDTSSQTTTILNTLDISYTPLQSINNLSNYDLLVIGYNSADAQVGSSHQTIRDFVDAGGRVIVFEQERDTYPNLDGIFPGIKASTVIWGNASHCIANYADIGAPTHPLFAGLHDGICNWRGEYGRICEFAFPRPYNTTARSLLYSGRWSTSLIEGFYGNGQYLLCQTNVTSRYGQEPEATILIHNMLFYGISTSPYSRGDIAYVGDVGGLLNSFTATNITGSLTTVDLSQYDVLILGRNSMLSGTEVTNNSQKILDFADAGGTVFILPQFFSWVNGWLPGIVNLRGARKQFIMKDEGANSSMLWGLCGFDLSRYYIYTGTFALVNEWDDKVYAELYNYSSEWSSLVWVSDDPANWSLTVTEPVGELVPTGGSAILEAKYGQGRIILCQVFIDSETSLVDPAALAGGETKEHLLELAPRLAADALLTNMVFAPTACYVTPKLPADLNKDCHIDWQDIALATQNWLIGGGDVTGDSYLNFKDFAIVAAYWMDCYEPDCSI